MIRIVYQYKTLDINNQNFVVKVVFIVDEKNICYLDYKHCLIESKRFDKIMNKFMICRDLDFKNNNESSSYEVWDYLIDDFGFIPRGNLKEKQYVCDPEPTAAGELKILTCPTDEVPPLEWVKKGQEEQRKYIEMFDEKLKELTPEQIDEYNKKYPKNEKVSIDDVLSSDKFKKKYDEIFLNQTKESEKIQEEKKRRFIHLDLNFTSVEDAVMVINRLKEKYNLQDPKKSFWQKFKELFKT